MIRKSVMDAAVYQFDSPVFGKKKSPTSRSDFGGQDTVGLNLRRIGLSFDLPGEFPMDESFGVFLGKHDDGWVVALKKFDYSGLSGAEVFPDLDSLQRRWELD
jgi:hypothetical protein